MNMKTNLAQQPTNDNADYPVGDVVVSLCSGINPVLFEVRERAHVTYPEFIKCRPIPNGTYFCWLAVNEIRSASALEVREGERLIVEINETFKTDSDFVSGDVVVYIDSNKPEGLMTVHRVQKHSVLMDGNRKFALKSLVRHASVREIQDGKRHITSFDEVQS